MRQTRRGVIGARRLDGGAYTARMKAATLALALLVTSACKASPLGADPVDAAATIDAPSQDGWTPLIMRGWSLPAGATNTYVCTRIKVTSDIWVSGFRVAAPLGSHHAVLTISSASTPLGDYPCGAGTLDSQMLYAAGVGTDDLVFPAGVAIHLTAGTYLNLNLHLFNATEATLTNTSGVLVKVVQPADVQHEADMMFSGTFAISVPADGAIHTAKGGCTAPTDWHIFTLWPHMHQVATHQTWTFSHAGAPTMLLDDQFRFEEQRNYPIADTLVRKGDTIQTVCTYVNNTKNDISYGDGSDKEMCFTGMYKYPAGGNLFQCTNPQ